MLTRKIKRPDARVFCYIKRLMLSLGKIFIDTGLISRIAIIGLEDMLLRMELHTARNINLGVRESQ